MTNTVPPAITTFYEAICRGDRATAERFVSPDFGQQDGKTREVWIDHELTEFAHRKEALGFTTVVVSPEASPAIVGLNPFSVTTGHGSLLFEEALAVGADGKIVGNGRRFEIVTKLLFRQGGETRRAVAIRSPSGEVAAAIPDLRDARDILLSPGMNYANDRFATLSFAIEGDTLAGTECSLYIKGEGPSARERIYLRGIDSPRFRQLSAPVIHERFVDMTALGGMDRLWSITAELADGTYDCLEHPPFDVITCRTNVRKIVITDALDNDWEWTV